jgi:hypothetical protein
LPAHPINRRRRRIKVKNGEKSQIQREKRVLGEKLKVILVFKRHAFGCVSERQRDKIERGNHLLKERGKKLK